MSMKKWMNIMKNIEIECHYSVFVQGCILTFLGIMLPLFIREENLGIYDTLHEAMMSDNSSLFLAAAVKLIMMNVIRAVPHYLGAFLIDESVQIYVYKKRRFTFNVVFTISLIMLVYDIIDVIYGIRYDFGIPALLIVAFVLLLSYMNLFSVSMINKVLIVGSLLMSVQWLDIIPGLSEHGFGRGEISMDVKIAAAVTGEANLLSMFATCMFLTFLYASLIQVQLLHKEHKLKISNEKTRKVENELYHTQIEALKMRNHSEVQSLVHDLKSPLTTIQGLISLAEIMETNDLIREYFKKISTSLTSMNLMISEILYENKKSLITTEDLMAMVLAQVSILVPNELLHYKNACPEAMLMGNKIRLSRAIINTITNAYHAVDKESGRIILNVKREESWICISVTDNGSGISPENMGHIWELGYSENRSTGLGMAFIKQVIENHKGTIEIQSDKGKYTEVHIRLEGET